MTAAAVLGTIAAGFAFGVLVGDKKIFPYLHLQAAYRLLTGVDASLPLVTLSAQEIRATIDVRTAEDAQALRQALIAHVWNSADIPRGHLPQTVRPIPHGPYKDIASLERIDELTYRQEYGIPSVMYHFHSRRPFRGATAILHQGHGGDFVVNLKTIRALLDAGYDVIAIAMPFLWRNRPEGDVVWTERYGPILFQARTRGHQHNVAALLWRPDFEPIRLFLDPVNAALNYLADVNPGHQVHMIGLSGGGRTATVYAAMDPRIKSSMAVSATLPMYLRGWTSACTGTDPG